MNHYIGVKLIAAEPKGGGKGEFPEAGYRVRYPDGYESWSPKTDFDPAHIMIDNENTIDANAVGKFIKAVDVSDLDDRTTMVRAHLANGFIITETSACADPETYDQYVGERICMDKIRIKVWDYLGFLLCCAVNGVN